MDVGMDTGDMILKQEVEIAPDETTGQLWERLSKIGGNLLVETLQQIANGTAPRIPQGEEFSMAPMLDKEISRIDWNSKNAQEIKNLVRGLDPIMGTYSYLDGKKIKIWKVDILQNDNLNVANGTVVKSDSKDGLYIKAKDGIIKVIEIQGENAKRMNIQDFLRGNNIEVGSKFE
jgi:methionyl-tRNA formyltransferase